MVKTDYSLIKKEEFLPDYWGYVQQTIQHNETKVFIVTEKGSLTYGEVNLPQSCKIISKKVLTLSYLYNNFLKFFI